MDSEDDDTKDGGARGEDHHGGVVDAEDGRVVSRRDPAGDRHQEHRHVQHGRDTQRHLLPGLCRDQEDEQSDDVDQNRGLDVVEQEKLWSPPYNKIISGGKYIIKL